MTILHEIIAPKENADNEVMVRKLYFDNKDYVRKNDELIDLETSKTAIIIDAAIEGYVEYLVKPSASVSVGEIIIRIHDSPESIDSSCVNNDNERLDAVFDSIILSRKAEKYVNTHSVDVVGINKRFVKLSDVVSESPENKGVDKELNPLIRDLPVVSEKISLAKKIEISALSSVQSSGLVSTLFVNVDDCILPKVNNLIIGSKGINLSYVVLESSRLLTKYPELNAYYEDGVIYKYQPINVGIALDINHGLKTYVIDNADKLDVEQLEFELSQGIYLYLKNSLTSDQIAGSTFTVTDLSAFGIDRFIPLVNYRQSAILGVSSFDEKLKRFTLSISFDHRVTEGKRAGQFLVELSSNLQRHGVA